MESKPFLFHPEANADFRDAIQWYWDRSPSIASEFRASISGLVEEIASVPGRWPRYLHGTRRFVVPRFPYSIIYLDDPDVVTIIAVAHSSRRPGYWRQRI